MVIPRDCPGDASPFQERLLGGILASVPHHETDCRESVRDDRALRWSDNVVSPPNDENCRACDEYTEAEKVSGPEANVSFHVGRS